MQAVNEENLEQSIQDLGRSIFAAIGNNRPSTLNPQNIAGQLLEWSMGNPDFKVNMFRLVDVLPALKTSQAVTSHIQEYLQGSAANVHALLNFGVKIAPLPLIKHIAAFTVRKSVTEMARMFIAGESAASALPKLRKLRSNKLCFTVDLLGEYSVNEQEADEYLNRYIEALSVLGSASKTWKESAPLLNNHPADQSPVNVSIKLSALYSQCSMLNFDRSVSILSRKLEIILEQASKVNARIYLDAEDSGTNPIILTVFKQVFSSPRWAEFPLPGIVLQAYTKSARKTLLQLIAFAKERGRPIAVRLVKGAYWDQETVQAAQNDWPSPLFSQKESSDAFYEELSRLLLDNYQHTYPAFGSHNIRSLAQACIYARHIGLSNHDFELQMLYGMAEPIARAFADMDYLVRLYVPLGEILPGMGYLVRRLLENTSNESFLRHSFAEDGEISNLLAKPHMRDDLSNEE